METLELSVDEREVSGKNRSKALRKEDIVPGVLYGSGVDNVNVQLSRREYRNVIKGTNPSQLFKLKSESGKLNEALVLVKDVQIEPIKDKVIHVDIVKLQTGQSIVVTIPVTLVGESAPVKNGLAVLSQIGYKVEVDCIPSKIPSELELDITNLEEGQTLHAGDVVLPEGVTLKSESTAGLVTAISKRRADAAAEAAEAAEATEAAAEAPEAPAEEGEKKE